MKPSLSLRCKAEEIAQAVCEVFDIDSVQLISAPKSKTINIARGLYCAIATLAGIHPTEAAATIKRSRANVITVAKHYCGYLEVGDNLTTGLYNKIVNNLQSKQDKDEQLGNKQFTD